MYTLGTLGTGGHFRAESAQVPTECPAVIFAKNGNIACSVDECPCAHRDR